MAFAFFLCFETCLAAAFLSFTVADSDVSSRSQANAASNSETTCAWNCKVIDSKFGSNMLVLTSKFKITDLQLTYKQQEGEKCLNQTDLHNSSLAELWKWLTGDIPSDGGQSITQQFFNTSNNCYRNPLEGQIAVGISCSLKPAANSNAIETNLNDVIALVVMEEVARFAGPLSLYGAAFCYKVTAENGFFVCANFTSNDANISYMMQIGLLVPVALFMSLFPFVLRSFTPTEFKESRTRRVMIRLHDETSPENICSRIVNKLCSHDNGNDAFRMKRRKWFFALLLTFFDEVYSTLEAKYFPPSTLLMQHVQSYCLNLRNTTRKLFIISVLWETNFIFSVYFFVVVEIVTHFPLFSLGSMISNFHPYATLGFFIRFLWNCHMTYDRNYNTLAFILYRHYAAESAVDGGNRQVPHVPKELYIKARDELMPQEGKNELLIMTTLRNLALVIGSKALSIT